MRGCDGLVRHELGHQSTPSLDGYHSRTQPEHRQPLGEGGCAYTNGPSTPRAGASTAGGRRAQRRLAGDRADDGRQQRLHHEQGRIGGGGGLGRRLGRLVGRRSALSRTRLRLTTPSRPTGGRRHHVHVRHRRNRVRARAGPGGLGDKDVRRRRRQHGEPVLAAELLDELHLCIVEWCWKQGERLLEDVGNCSSSRSEVTIARRWSPAKYRVVR